MTAALKIAGGIVLLLIVLFGLVITIVPRFLDRIYYRGPATDHFDGERFANPDGDEDTIRIPAGGSRVGFFWRYLTGSDGRPAWPDRVDVAQAVPPPRVEGERMLVTWVGHATVLIQTNGLNILTDPVWSDRAGPLGFGPKRVAQPGIAFANLPRIDLVLVSHNHYDHLDKATLKRLWDRDRPVFVTSLGNDAILRDAGIPERQVYDCDRCTGVQALDWGRSATVVGAGWERWKEKPVEAAPMAMVHVTRNHHWGSRWFTDRNRALWSSFVVSIPSGGNIFFAGDTGWGDGKWPAEAAALGPIRFAMIPIGAFRFTPGQMSSGSHIGPGDAALIFQRLGAAHAIPIHWGTFRLSYEAYDTPPKMLAAAMTCIGASGFAPAKIGVPLEIPIAGPPAPGKPMARDAMMRCLDTPAVRALP